MLWGHSKAETERHELLCGGDCSVCLCILRAGILLRSTGVSAGSAEKTLAESIANAEDRQELVH